MTTRKSRDDVRAICQEDEYTEIESPKVNMSNGNLKAKESQGGNRSARRGWRCPDDAMVAAYLDGVVDTAAERRIQSHLAGCEYCRSLVADVVTMQRFDAPFPPLGLEQRAVGLVTQKWP